MPSTASRARRWVTSFPPSYGEGARPGASVVAEAAASYASEPRSAVAERAAPEVSGAPTPAIPAAPGPTISREGQRQRQAASI